MTKYIDQRNSKTILSEQDIKDMLKAGKDPLNKQHKATWLGEKALREFEMQKNKTKQNHWNNWPTARKIYWAKREILTHNEFIYLLKEKEPRSLNVKPTQFDYFPLAFCVFHDEVVKIIEDARIMKKITPIYQDLSNLYPKAGFKAIDLIELSISKNIHIPDWLIPNVTETLEEVPKELIERFPFLNKNDPFYSTKFHHAFECWMNLYGPNGSVRKNYDKNTGETMKDKNNFGNAIYSWLDRISQYDGKKKKSGAAYEIFKVINPNKNPRTKK